MRIFLDPKVGFCVRRIERGPLQKSIKPSDKYTTLSEVQEFKDCGNGIFWPLRVATTSRRQGEKVGVDRRTEFTLHSINQPMPEEDFEIPFPDWLRIYDHSARRVIIWGPDDKPRMIFSPEEYEEWYSPRRADPRQDPNASRNRLLWLAGISSFVGLLLLFLILWQRKMQRRIRGSTQLIETSQGDEGGMP